MEGVGLLFASSKVIFVSVLIVTVFTLLQCIVFCMLFQPWLCLLIYHCLYVYIIYTIYGCDQQNKNKFVLNVLKLWVDVGPLIGCY